MNRLLTVLLTVTLISCGEGAGSSSGRTSDPSVQQENSYGPAPHNDVEVEEEGDVEILDATDEDSGPDDAEEYVPDYNLAPTAQQRMNELLQSSSYTRNSGKPKRSKIATQLNREDFRKSDGSKFKRRDIPKG